MSNLQRYINCDMSNFLARFWQMYRHQQLLPNAPAASATAYSRRHTDTVTLTLFFVQRALVLEDYAPPALRVQGFVSRKKGARSMGVPGEEQKEGEKET